MNGQKSCRQGDAGYDGLTAFVQELRSTELGKYTGTIEERLAQVVGNNRAKNEQRASRASSTLKTQDIIAAWRIHVPNEVHPTAKEIGAFRRNLKLAMVSDIPAFFAEVVERWEEIRAGEMAWMSSMPVTPSFGFVALWTRRLKQAMNQQTASNKRRSLATALSEVPATPTHPKVAPPDYAAVELQMLAYREENQQLKRALVKATRRKKSSGQIAPALEKRHD